MTDFSDSLGASASLDLAEAKHEAKLQVSLQAGLTALKQRDYPKAIAELSDCEASLDAATRLKAQMGLIKAYVRTEQVQAAALLAQPLCDHANPQVQRWAKQTLGELTGSELPESELPESELPPSSNDTTGFVPLNPKPPGSASRPKPRTRKPVESAMVSANVAAVEATHSETIWRNAGRIQKWNSLGAVDASGLWALQAGSLVLLFWLSKTLLRSAFGLWNEFSIAVSNVISTLRFILPTEIGLPLLLLLLILASASPWLMQLILQRAYGLQSLKLSQLENLSPESARILRRVCKQQSIPVPDMGRLPTAAPIIFSYGYLPRHARIAVSQGLLDQLNDDETATLFAAELAHIRYWDFGALSAMTLIAQIPYLVYWQVANWGDRWNNPIFKTLAVIASSIGYGLFRLLRLPGLWLSRVRLYYSDRLATDLTGNPNGLTRALLKVAAGTAQQMQQQTEPLLESFESLAPVGYRSSLASGIYRGDAALFNWDCHSPYRRWLQLNNSHPPLGERLALLMQYAQQWRLPPEVELSKPSRAKPTRRLLLQGAPFFGILFGAFSALLLWAAGQIATQLRWFELSWLATDQSVFWACCLLGFGIGLFLRINAFYPDIKRANLVDFNLPQLLSDPQRLPLDSLPMQIQGKLVGQAGLQNWLYRDLMLQTPTGLIRLHYTSQLGWLSDLFPKQQRPTELIGRMVTVTGWFRRGATPWIDLERIQIQSGRSLLSHHPIGSTVLAAAAVLLAVYLILRGGG